MRSVSRDLKVHRHTIRKYLDHLINKGVSLEEALKLEDKGLKLLLGGAYIEPKAPPDGRFDQLEGQISELLFELGRKGVTKQLLYEEYIKRHPEGYGRSQFYIHLRQTGKINKAVMKLHHMPGEQMMIDYAGDPLKAISKNMVLEIALILILNYKSINKFFKLFGPSLRGQLRRNRGVSFSGIYNNKAKFKIKHCCRVL